MDLDLLKRFLWLLCLFAEGVILLYLRAFLVELEGQRGRNAPVAAACSGAFAVLGALVLFGEYVFGASLEAMPGHRFTIYYWSAWNLVSTSFVAVELVIVVYLFRLDRLLDGDTGGEAAPSVLRLTGAIAVLAAYVVYAGYVYGMFRLVDRHAVGWREVQNLSIFYVRVCCGLCVLLEWVVAVFALRAYRRLAPAAKENDGSPALGDRVGLR